MHRSSFFPEARVPVCGFLTGTLYSFGIFALAFVARPFGTVIFTAVDRAYGRGAKLTIALFLLGGSTMSMAFVPSYNEVGVAAVWMLALLRVGQGVALGGTWDGLASLLALNSPQKRRGWYAMVPQLGAPLGLMVASLLFAYFIANLSPEDFLDWGWRFPFFVAFAINVVALFARLRIVVTPEYAQRFETHDLEPASISGDGARDRPQHRHRCILRRSQASRCFTSSRCFRCRGCISSRTKGLRAFSSFRRWVQRWVSWRSLRRGSLLIRPGVGLCSR